MREVDLLDAIAKRKIYSSDKELAEYLGVTTGRISQMRKNGKPLTTRQMVTYLDLARDEGFIMALEDPIKPVVEMFPIEPTASKQDKKMEPIPTGVNNPRNKEIRQHLEGAKGIYVFFDSSGKAIYAGKTERQNLWKEMVGAYNRKRADQQAFLVPHPSTDVAFSIEMEKKRQPKKRPVYLHSNAAYFSAYEVSLSLIPTLEALLVRVFCNTLSNKKMERF